MNRPGSPIGPFGRLAETETAYRTNPAISNSDMNLFRMNEAMYRDVKILGLYPRPDTDALKFGRAFHCYVLEQKQFDKRYAVFQGKVRNGKAWDEFEAANKDKAIITKKELCQIEAMNEAMCWNREASVLLDECESEVVFREKQPNGLARQCRVDGISPFGEIIDLKSCDSIEEFRYNLSSFGYHRQAVWYSSIVNGLTGEIPKFTFIAVEKKAPYRCEMFRLSHEYEMEAAEEIAGLWKRLSTCLETDTWERNRPGIQLLEAKRRWEAA